MWRGLALAAGAGGTWTSYGEGTACRTDSGDKNGFEEKHWGGYDLASCQQLCDEITDCGIEYEASTGECELWIPYARRTANMRGHECWYKSGGESSDNGHGGDSSDDGHVARASSPTAQPNATIGDETSDESSGDASADAGASVAMPSPTSSTVPPPALSTSVAFGIAACSLAA